MSGRRKEFGALAALVAVPLAAPSVTAQTPPATNNCVTEALSFDQMQRGATSTLTCYRTLDEMLAAMGAAPSDGHRVKAQEATARLLAGDPTLAVHYDAANPGGSYLGVTGACSGGGVTFQAGDGWNDRISSTTHQLCGRVKHFSDANASGDLQITNGSPNDWTTLNGQLNNRVSSIYYYT